MITLVVDVASGCLTISLVVVVVVVVVVWVSVYNSCLYLVVSVPSRPEITTVILAPKAAATTTPITMIMTVITNNKQQMTNDRERTNTF